VILEGILTTVDPDGSARLSPMGAIVDRELTAWQFRPFLSSHSYANLLRTREGIFHVVDDMELLARAAIGRLETPPEFVEIPGVRGFVLADACRWYACEITAVHDRSPRASMECQITSRGHRRDFFGLNRAMHAIVEAAILATRVAFLDAQEIRERMQQLEPLVIKTGEERELRAFGFLREYINEVLQGPDDRIAGR